MGERRFTPGRCGRSLCCGRAGGPHACAHCKLLPAMHMPRRRAWADGKYLKGRKKSRGMPRPNFTVNGLLLTPCHPPPQEIVMPGGNLVSRSSLTQQTLPRSAHLRRRIDRLNDRHNSCDETDAYRSRRGLPSQPISPGTNVALHVTGFKSRRRLCRQPHGWSGRRRKPISSL